MVRPTLYFDELGVVYHNDKYDSIMERRNNYHMLNKTDEEVSCFRDGNGIWL